MFDPSTMYPSIPQGPPMGGSMPMPAMPPMAPMEAGDPMEATSGPETGDPSALIVALKALAGQNLSVEPVYPAGFKAPPKPTVAKIIADSRKLFDADLLWRSMIQTTLKWTNQNLTGAFPEDIEDRRLGFQEEFISTYLSDQRNLAISKLSTLKASWLKRAPNDLRGYAQKLEDAAGFIRAELEHLHARDGNRPMSLDEAALMVDYGMLTYRQTFFPTDPELPIRRCYIDPTQVYPVWGGPSGLKAVHRVYQDTLDNLRACYGAYDPETIAKLEKRYGTDKGDDAEIQVYEYWDEWWRCVIVEEEPIVPIVAHEYGFVPWVVQYGGLGDPMFTRSPVAATLSTLNGQITGAASGRSADRITKATPFVFYMVRNHELMEAIMARIVTGFKKAINPPTIRARSDMAAEKPMNPLDTSPGAQNEIMRGEEDITAMPSADTGPAAQILLGKLATDQENGGFGRAAFGATAQMSNVTGVAQNAALDAGLDKLIPLVKPFEHAEARGMEQAFLLIRNFGDDAKYGGAKVTPLLVQGRVKNSDAFELDAELIDKVGPRISVAYTRIDEKAWLPLIQAGQMGVQAGFLRPSEIRERLMGEHDWETHHQEWINETALIQATQLPEFAKAVTVPNAFAKEILAHAGDPEMQALLVDQLNQWKQLTAPAPQGPPPGPGGPQPGGPPQGAPVGQDGGGGPPPPPPGSQIVSTSGVSLPAMNQAPGSQGMAVGRPGM